MEKEPTTNSRCRKQYQAQCCEAFCGLAYISRENGSVNASLFRVSAVRELLVGLSELVYLLLGAVADVVAALFVFCGVVWQ